MLSIHLIILRVKDLRELLNEKRAQSQNNKRLSGGGECTICKKEAFLKCMKCDKFYCSAACQVRDNHEQHVIF